jgi:hypothetical protein
MAGLVSAVAGPYQSCTAHISDGSLVGLQSQWLVPLKHLLVHVIGYNQTNQLALG